MDEGEFLRLEFQELRKEIDRRSREQYQLISGATLSSVALLGAATKSAEAAKGGEAAASGIIICLIPWLLTVAATLWCEDHDEIRRIAEYIREHIETSINWETVAQKRRIGWEEFVDAAAKRQKLSPSHALVVSLGVYFLVPSIVAIVAAFYMSPSPWLPGVTAVISCGWLIYRFIISFKKIPKGR